MRNVKLDKETLDKVSFELNKIEARKDDDLRSEVGKTAVDLCLLHIYAKLKEINDYLEKEI